ncbi:hypothetical protein BDV12DRAFT_200645 [Aspergillus spectabilis]
MWAYITEDVVSTSKAEYEFPTIAKIMKASSPFRIVIVGGGIAGITAAIALRAPNRRLIVLEQARLNKEIGALISLQPNASKIVYDTFGLGSELENARGMIDEGFRIYSTDGELVNEIPLTIKAEYGGTESQLKSESRLAWSDAILGGEYRLRERRKVEGDMIIGADGIHSALRNYVVDSDLTPMPTGYSAYRLMIPSDILEEKERDFCSKIDPRSSFTSMMVAHNCRLIMSPGRQGDVYGIVALVPDEKMNEDPNVKQSWVAEGNLNKMLETFSEFPEWVTGIFKHSPDLGLWQLRDIDPLPAWSRDRLILIGDAAHAMLPTQGQGASQAIEDSEALGAFFADTVDAPSLKEITKSFGDIFRSRHGRASLIQGYSRQAAKPGTAKGEKSVTMKPDEFMAFNCVYNGAKEWFQRQATSNA